MSQPFEPHDLLDGFAGTAPMFPLPDLAFFPHVLLPLHIFEPRYRQMTADALAGDRLIAMATLRPDWENADDPSRPRVFDHMCVGRITAEEQLPDGRFYLILQGLCRAEMTAEVDADAPYRVAKLDLLRDVATVCGDDCERGEKVERLLTQFAALFPKVDIGRVSKFRGDDPRILGVVCDVLSAAGRLGTPVCQKMLATPDIDDRADLLLSHFARLIEKRATKKPVAAGAKFPPDFSLN